MSAADFDTVHGVNSRGVFLCLKYEIGAMSGSGGGAIVNTSSSSGERGIPHTADYTAAKHGVVGLTRAAAAEVRYTGVRVNAILPGLIVTPMVEHLKETPEFIAFNATNATAERHSIGRYGEPIDVARVVKWLLSDESGFVNGVALPVDVGYLAR
jgi:NAD(P)-dependent dehydrogenase (short-subunit alcohol dehydrogenase family)